MWWVAERIKDRLFRLRRTVLIDFLWHTTMNHQELRNSNFGDSKCQFRSLQHSLLISLLISLRREENSVAAHSSTHENARMLSALALSDWLSEGNHGDGAKKRSRLFKWLFIKDYWVSGVRSAPVSGESSQKRRRRRMPFRNCFVKWMVWKYSDEQLSFVQGFVKELFCYWVQICLMSQGVIQLRGHLAGVRWNGSKINFLE